MPRAVFANYTLKVNDLAFLDVVHELFCCPCTVTFILNIYCTIQSVHIHENIFAHHDAGKNVSVHLNRFVDISKLNGCYT